MRRYRVGSFPLLERWPRWPTSDDACHLYLGDATSGVCGRTSGNATSALSELNCLGCWWRMVRLWLLVLLGLGPTSEKS